MTVRLSTAAARAALTAEEATHTLRFVRDLDAPPKRVFAAWTTPEQLARWWGTMGEGLAGRVGLGWRSAFLVRGEVRPRAATLT